MRGHTGLSRRKSLPVELPSWIDKTRPGLAKPVRVFYFLEPARAGNGANTNVGARVNFT